MRYRWWLCAVWGTICLAFLVWLFIAIPGWDTDSGDWVLSGTATFILFVIPVAFIYGLGFLVIVAAADFVNWLQTRGGKP